MSAPPDDLRVLVLAPTSRDAAMARALMAPAGIALEFCQGLDGLIQELRAGAAAILVPEEAVLPPRGEMLAAALRSQPPWSDLPVLLMTRPGAETAGLDEAASALGNVMLLERPLRVATLTSALRTAVRARERQYQIRAHLAERARDEAALREADQRKDEFLATLGHELRNPLAPLATALELLKRSHIEGPLARHAAEVMERQVAHLIRLVDDLLELSRITRGIIDVQREPLDLAAVVRAALDTSRPALDAGGHRVEVDVPSAPVMVSGDTVRLTQVFANLLTNAAKYTNAGGHVWVSLRCDGGEARVSVRDDGIGIPLGQLASVFDMFTQVDRSTRRTQGGLGIGLTLVRSLVSMHGGRVEAYSDGPGCGSEFVVHLPLAEAARPLPPAGRTLQRLPSRRVLIVDDNALQRLALTQLAVGWHMEVTAVADAPGALAALSRSVTAGQPFDLALIDLVLPGDDGYTIARAIRTTPAFGRTQTVIVTSHTHHTHRQLALAAGAVAFVPRPVRQTALKAVLRRLLAPAAAQRRSADDLSPTAEAASRRDARQAGRILVVEDNSVNQLVTARQLEQRGYRVDVAADGAEALSALARRSYALILMDCRMPVMDGFTATASIRATEDPARRMPIIALTANALAEDRAQCLRAGMDDYLTKPVRAEALLTMVERWLPSASRQEPAAPARDRTAHGAQVPTLDRALLEEIVGMPVQEALPLVGELVELFNQDTPAALEALRRATAAGDISAIRDRAHYLKGCSTNLALSALAVQCTAIDGAAAEGELPSPAVLAQLQAE